jgi:hypothetical protein
MEGFRNSKAQDIFLCETSALVLSKIDFVIDESKDKKFTVVLSGMSKHFSYDTVEQCSTRLKQLQSHLIGYYTQKGIFFCENVTIIIPNISLVEYISKEKSFGVFFEGAGKEFEYDTIEQCVGRVKQLQSHLSNYYGFMRQKKSYTKE